MLLAIQILSINRTCFVLLVWVEVERSLVARCLINNFSTYSPSVKGLTFTHLKECDQKKQKKILSEFFFVFSVTHVITRFLLRKIFCSEGGKGSFLVINFCAAAPHSIARLEPKISFQLYSLVAVPFSLGATYICSLLAGPWVGLGLALYLADLARGRKPAGRYAQS